MLLKSKKNIACVQAGLRLEVMAEAFNGADQFKGTLNLLHRHSFHLWTP